MPVRRPLQVLRQYADLNLQMNARFELRFDRLRNLRCTPTEVNQLGSGCRGGFNPPRFEPQFNVRSGGVVGQRININVDYDTQREFEASNDIRLFYQGLPDEILRRVEVGNVTFQAPSSRFITGGIPANNFGFQAQGQLGAVDFTAIFAQQKGNVVRGRTFTIGNQSVQPLDREVFDRDFEPLRFFFVVDPQALPGFPAVDVLRLDLTAVAAHDRVAQVRVYRRRSRLSQAGTTEQNLSGINAVARRSDSGQRAGPFPWELLLEGRDYYLDPSGLWFGLTARLDEEDYLAVSYVTAFGDTVGTFPAQAAAGRVDTLQLVYEPRRGADVPTFRYEMRNFYRVGSQNDVVRESAQLRLVVGETERPASGAATFLALLGVAQETDPTTFDQLNRLFPRQRDPASGAPLRDYYIVFPSLRPFADAGVLTPEFRNDSLYRTPTYLLRTQGPTPLYGLRLHYEARGGDNRALLSLGGFQIREGSEQITAAGRSLTRNVDYTINYEIGQVTFTSPDSLFREPTTVTVQYEEQPGFAIAPTSIYGLQGRYDLGEHGTVSVLGLLQRERTTFTRPPLGFEPASHFVAGVAGNLRFAPTGLTRLLDGLPFVATEAPSSITLDAELAMSRPSPNQLGVAYVETFESEGGMFLGLGEHLWVFGSRPSSSRGLEGAGIFQGVGFQDADAVPLTWQNLRGTLRGTVQFRARDIDPSIQVQGAAETAEPVLWFDLFPDTVGGLPDLETGALRWYVPHTPGPRWRSLTQPLSATGVDLSRVEYLEFWVYEDAQDPASASGATIAFDFGTVYEDAVDFQPTALRVSAPGDTVYTGRRRAGEGRLDTERDTLTNAFNATINDTGILGDVADSIVNSTSGTTERSLPLCTSELGRGLVVYSWGDLRERCSRRNGRADTEDLNGDQHLDTLITSQPEASFRYVFRIGDGRYFVRDGGVVMGADSATAGRWRLYRIPFRSDTLQVGLPNIRLVQHLRMTVVAPEGGPERSVFFALSRVKLVGSPWVKRSATPIAGLGGAQGTGHGEVIASVVSTENRTDLGYESPPGVTDQGDRRAGNFQVGQVQINERSLRLVGFDVRAGERAEAFYRFPEGDRNFLGYRQMRLWARGRGAAWDQGDLSVYVKIAQDENNFYLYRAGARTTSWEPEVVVDFRRWLALRAEIEGRYLRGEPPSGAGDCGGDSLAYVACDSSHLYLVQVRHPGVAPPNLSRVRELAVGFLRLRGAPLDSAEVWIDDIRLAQVVDDPGYAGAVNLRVVAADVGELTVSVTRRDGQFRQLGETPPYVGTSQLALASTVRLERFGLEPLGITAPLSVRLERSAQDPYFLNGTDVLGSTLDGLRTPRTSQTAFSLSVRRSRRGTLWWQRVLVDNVSFSVSGSRGSQRTELVEAGATVFDVRADYNASPPERAFRYVPGFLRRLVSALPAFLSRSEFARGMEGARLRWTPAQLRFTTSFNRTRAVNQTFRVPIATAGDALARRITVLQASLQNDFNLDLRPFRSLTLGVGYTQVRDLRDYGDTTTVGVLTKQDGRRLAGLNLGFERRRALRTQVFYQPNLASWVRPRASLTSQFSLNRDPNSPDPERLIGDTAGAYRVPMAFENQRAADLGAAIDFSRLARGLAGDSSFLARLADRLNVLDLSSRLDRRSQFSRRGISPDVPYQLALGGGGAFRSHGGAVADAAYDAREARAGSGVRLPLGTSLTSEYSLRRTTTWARRGQRQSELRQSEVSWPNIAARWAWSPRQGLLRRVIASLSGSVAYRSRETESVQPSLEIGPPGEAVGTTEAQSRQTTRAWPISVTVNWAPRITTNAGISGSRSEDRRSGNVVRTDQREFTADVSFTFRPPQQIFPLPSDVRTALRYANSANQACIERAGVVECIPVSDSRRRRVNFTMDTDLPPNVSAGVSLSYILTQDAHTNRKFSQFVVAASVTVAFSAGEIR
ncbi:MAG: cell surface protein SprA [Gemmatimonadota bacterium]